MTGTIDLTRAFLHLDGAGDAKPIELTASFWRGSADAQRYERVVGAVDFRSAEDLHSSLQEMHPGADEVLVVISGAVDVLLAEAGSERTVALEPGQAAIVPRGVWHRVVMRRPGRLLFINNRKAIETRPLCANPGGQPCSPI